MDNNIEKDVLEEKIKRYIDLKLQEALKIKIEPKGEVEDLEEKLVVTITDGATLIKGCGSMLTLLNGVTALTKTLKEKHNLELEEVFRFVKANIELEELFK